MKNRLVTFLCVVAAIGSVCAFAFDFNSPTSHTEQMLAPFEFRRDAAPTPEAAAQSLFLGVATASPEDFVQHLLLGACYNGVDVLQDFAEAKHATQFRHDDAGVGSDGLEYQTSVVVAQLSDGWYAIPRCRSSKNFYKIADAMSLAHTEAAEAN